ncbi:MAG: condensation domain-containing protein, partial [Flavobacterium sp.]
DGTVAFLGRKDHQVKIRGYRIELREIESIFYQYSQSIKQVVIEPKDVNGDKILIAYYVSDVIEDKVIIDHYLKDKLPVYMIPSFYVELHTLPLTPNGKIDRKALPNISGNDLIRREFIAPRNDLEKKLAAIWQEILRIEKVSITDNFFDIGGHSLKVILLVGLILKRLSAKVTIMQIFDHPDLKSQAQLISSSNKEIYFDIAKIKEEKNYDMTYEQKRIWLLSLDKKASITYNMSFHAELKGEFDFENFKKAVLSALDRHEILRTVFKEDENGEIKQWVLSTEELNFEIDQVDLRQDLNQEELVKDYIHKKSTTVFDLEKGPLLSVGYLLLEESRKVIVYNMYHIISDGWSMNVLVRDVTEFYNAYCENREPNLPVLNIQYKDYAAWQHNEVTNIKVKQQEEYWGKLFEKGIPKVKLPFEKQRPENFTHTGNRAKFRINKELMEGLTSISSKNKGSMYITFMTLVKLALYKYTGDEYNMVGSSFSTRNHNNLQNQIGFYVNNLPVFSTIKKEDTFQAVYESIKHTVLSVNSNSWFPLELLLKQIKYKHDKSFSGLFNVLVEFHQKNDYVENGDTAVEPIQEEIVFDYDFPCQFDFSLEFFENKNHIDGIMVYNKALFDENHIELFVKRFLNIIKQLTGQLEDLNLIKVADINLDIMKVADSTISKKTTILEENF